MKECKTAVALGFFDGVHIGHKMLINKIKELEESGLKSCVYTFDKHPAEVLGSEVPLVVGFENKIKTLKETGVSLVYVQKTDMEFLNILPEMFVDEILVKKLNAAHVVAGENFTFGKNKSGNAEVLRKLCSEKGIGCTILPCKMVDETVVSSTEVRKAIKNGDVELASKYLGRPYTLSGTVRKGTNIGEKIGFPTANILPDEKTVLLPNGVYASTVILDGKEYPAITNIGTAPTFDKTETLIETNIFDFDGDIYDKDISVKIISYMRAEQKFLSVQELIKQIQTDVEKRRKMNE